MSANSEFSPHSFGTLAASLTGNLFGAMTLLGVGLAVFMQAIATDTGWSRAEIGAAISIIHISMAISTMTVGRLADRLGPRKLVLPMTATSALLLMALSIPISSFPVFFAVCVLVGFFTPGTVYYSKLLSLWFFQKRGSALGLISAGTMLTNMLAPPACALLLDFYGWRQAFLVFGLAILSISLPVLFMLFQEPGRPLPAARGQASAPVDDGATPVTVRQAWKIEAYWTTLGAHFGGIFAFIAFTSHGIGILSDRGASREIAVLGLSVAAGASLVAQLVTGFLLDRFPTPRIIVPFAATSVVGMALIQSGFGTPVLLLGAALFGLGCGAENGTLAYFTTRYFGVRNFAVVYGSKLPFLLMAAAPAPILVGRIFDMTGSYDIALWIMQAFLVGATFFVMALKPYPYASPTPLAAATPSPSPVQYRPSRA